MLKDTGKAEEVATFYYIKFCNEGASSDSLRLYSDLIGKSFIFRAHKKFTLDVTTLNLKLCFGKDCISEAEFRNAKKKGLMVIIEEVSPLLKEELHHHAINHPKVNKIFDK